MDLEMAYIQTGDHIMRRSTRLPDMRAQARGTGRTREHHAVVCNGDRSHDACSCKQALLDVRIRRSTPLSPRAAASFMVHPSQRRLRNLQDGERVMRKRVLFRRKTLMSWS